jgi:hypothetical protein
MKTGAGVAVIGSRRLAVGLGDVEREAGTSRTGSQNEAAAWCIGRHVTCCFADPFVGCAACPNVGEALSGARVAAVVTSSESSATIATRVAAICSTDVNDGIPDSR